MFDTAIAFLGEAGTTLLLLLGMLAVLGFRRPISVRDSIYVERSPEQVFSLIDFNSAEQGWHRGKVHVKLVDPSSRTYRFTYSSASGAAHSAQADFALLDHQPPHLIVAERRGLSSGVTANQLLGITARCQTEAGGSRVSLQYDWGPRTILAQLLARLELGGSLRRIKSFAETGKVDETHERRLSLLMAFVTAAVTLIGFGFFFGWTAAAILVFVVAVHEFGHLLAFRLIGQPWGRVIFIPFLGAIAMPRLPYRNQWEHAFSALMGPGFSVILLAPALFMPDGVQEVAHPLIYVTAALNGLNLLPALPLDGGHALRAIVESFKPGATKFAMAACAALIAGAAIILHLPILFAVALLTLFSSRQTPVDSLPAMTLAQNLVILTVYLGLAVLYSAFLWQLNAG
jgi:Zn-dependent protease